MVGSTRIKGAALSLVVGGTDVQADIISAVFDNEEADGDVTTFADAAAGGARQHFVTVSAIQSTESGSFWSYVWANSGVKAVYRYAPHGNAIATADQPHFLGTLTIGAKPSVGGEAGTKNTYQFETRFDIDGEPVLDRGTSAKAGITSVGPAGRGVGDIVIIAGTRFTGVTSVKFAAVEAEFIQVSDTTISVAIPAGTGSKAVTVTTPAGVSDAVNYTVA